MAGAGYDIGLAASQADNYTFGTPYVSNVLFSGSNLSGGSAVSQQRDSADATATTKSPGTVNNKSAYDAPFPSFDLGGKPDGSTNSKTFLIVGVIIATYLLLK